MLVVPDVKQASNLYEKVFGIVPIFELPDDTGRILFARLRYRGSNFTLTQEGAFGFDGKSPATTNTTPSFIFYLYVDDVDAVYSAAITNGFQSLEEPHDEFWGDKKARVKDSYGYIWDVALKANLG
ncbi:MAG: glyoxalase/bleomycin resistance protein/dioxygenase [uncultured bacterium]|nr:MAG: glyoxalase/bleomycin resistance protein/dioxygenase [uncultured bacterium]